jgi:hypothetical protein
VKKKPTNATINVRGTEITVVRRDNEDYISLTDMLKAKDGEFFISDWLRNRNTVEFLGIWETVHNPDFNSGEFAIIKSQAGLNSYKISVKEWVEKTNAIGLPEVTPKQAAITYANEADLLNVALFGQTAREWRDANPGKDGNMRDDATLEHLLVLANLENMNAEFIHMTLPQSDRIKRLNAIAIRQMQTLTARTVKQLEGGKA